MVCALRNRLAQSWTLERRVETIVRLKSFERNAAKYFFPLGQSIVMLTIRVFLQPWIQQQDSMLNALWTRHKEISVEHVKLRTGTLARPSTKKLGMVMVRMDFEISTWQ